MKKAASIIQKISLLASLTMVINCGLQVRDNPSGPGSGTVTTGNPATNGGNPTDPSDPVEAVYTVGGTTTGLPAGEHVTLDVGGVHHPISANGSFTLPEEYLSGEDYDVVLISTVIHSCGHTYDCTLANGQGTIVDHNVTDLIIKCVKRCH